MNKTMTKFLMKLRQHPKKFILLGFIISCIVANKNRNAIFKLTFQQILQRMNDRMVRQMNDQVNKLDQYNRKLAQLQIITEEYDQQRFKLLSNEFFLLKDIETLKNQMKNLKKDQPDYNQNRADIYTKLNKELIVFGVSVLKLNKIFDLLMFVQQLIFQRDRSKLNGLSEEEIKQLDQLFIRFQLDYIQRIYHKQRVILLNKNIPNYQDQINFKQFTEFLNELIIEDNLQQISDIIKINEFAIIKNQYEGDLKDKFQQFRENIIMNEEIQDKRLLIQSLTKAEIICIEILNEIMATSIDENVQSIYYFNQYLANTKQQNRFQMLQLKNGFFGVEPFFRLASNFQRICAEEFIELKAQKQNELFYERKIKLIFNYVNGNILEGDVKQIKFADKIVEESSKYTTLKLAVRQFSRKIYFLEEFDDLKDEQEIEDNGNQNGIAEQLLRFAQQAGVQ